MTTNWARYPLVAALVAVVAGLLVACGAAHPRASMTADRSGHPRTAATADRAGSSGNRLARIVPLPRSSRPAIVMTGPVGPGRATETYRAGRPGQTVLISGIPCVAGRHLESREITRSCPLAAVTLP